MTTHKAGPELDTLIAEKVMGWEVVAQYPKDCPDHGLYVMLASGKLWNRGGEWSPSTDIAAAWNVVEKFFSRCVSVSIADYRWHCSIGTGEHRGQERNAMNDRFDEQASELLDQFGTRIDEEVMGDLTVAIAAALREAAKVPADHVRTPDGREFQLWSTLRSGLTYCRESMDRAVSATSSDEESVWLDTAARQLTSHMIGPIRAEIDKAEANLAAKDTP